MSRKTLLIVYHSMTGGTRQMAEAARDGALQESEIQVRLQLRPVGLGPGDPGQVAEQRAFALAL